MGRTRRESGKLLCIDIGNTNIVLGLRRSPGSLITGESEQKETSLRMKWAS